MADLSVEYCGFKLINPFLLASAPPTTTGAMMKRAYQAGWAGAVTKTLVHDAESVVNVTPRLGSLSYPTADSEPNKIFAFMNIELVTDRSLAKWLKEIEDLVSEFPDRMTIASIMADASKPDGWVDIARQCAEAGAHAIEINMSCPHGMPERGMGMAIGQDVDIAANTAKWTAEAVDVPVIAKMTPNITDITAPAKACVKAGVDSISAINTVASIIGVDLDNLTPLPNVWGASTPGGLSGPAVKPIALRAVAAIAQAFLKGKGTIPTTPVSGIGGVTTWRDAAEFLLLGASNVQVCSSVMARGYGIVEDLIDGLSDYMEDKGFKSIDSMIGKALPNLKSHGELNAKKKMVAHIDPNLATNPGLESAYIACLDSGYQAIIKRKDDSYSVNTKRCTGCSLCYHVCPVEGAVTMVPKED